MIYMYGLQELGLAGQVIAALFAVGGCLRLARFNCNTGVVHGYFQGMPIPAGACFLATYVVFRLSIRSVCAGSSYSGNCLHHVQ